MYNNVYFIENEKFKASNSDIKRLLDRVQEKIDQSALLKKLNYSLADHKVGILFNNSVRRVGLARLKVNKERTAFSLFFEVNIKAFNENLDYILEKVVAHEVANLVCFINYNVLGKKIMPHGKEFKSVCYGLGGVLECRTDIFKSLNEGDSGRKKTRLISLYLQKQ